MSVMDRIDGVLNLARAMTDIAKSDGKSAAVITDLLDQLQSLREKLLAVRKEAAELQGKNLELANQLAATNDFERQRDQFALTTLSTGAVVYVPAGAREREVTVEQPVQEQGGQTEQPPTYYLCANCFEHEKRSYLQPAEQKPRVDTYSCHACGARVPVPNGRPVPNYQPIRIRRSRRIL